MPVPFVIYVDFESITEKVQGCQPNSAKSYTDKYQKKLAAVTGTKLYAVIMINIQNQ